MEHFPFEQYIYSCDEKEYLKDIRKKNYLLKYINLVFVDNLDLISLKRFVHFSIFFRSTFSKDSFLQFYLESFDDYDKMILAYIVFELFVRSNKGEIAEYKTFISLATRLQTFVRYENTINTNWFTIKKEMPDIV